MRSIHWDEVFTWKDKAPGASLEAIRSAEAAFGQPLTAAETPVTGTPNAANREQS